MELAEKRCTPCEGGTPPLPRHRAEELAGGVPAWTLEDDRLRRSWRLKDFMACIRLIDHVARIAEEEGHHPDLHLTGYRDLEVVLWTHAVGGLSENDFILAAKVDRVAP